MSVVVEAQFTSALGLKASGAVADLKLDTGQRRIAVEIGCQGKALTYLPCGAGAQPIQQDRLRRTLRHLDFFQYEAWLQGHVPVVACGNGASPSRWPWGGRGRARGSPRGWSRRPSRCAAKIGDTSSRGLARLRPPADAALHRALRRAGSGAGRVHRGAALRLAEVGLREGQDNVTMVHDVDDAWLMFATEGRNERTAQEFAADLKAAHGDNPAEVRHVSTDLGAAFALGVAKELLAAQICFDRLHVVAMQAMDEVRRQERAEEAPQPRSVLGHRAPTALRQLKSPIGSNPAGWSRSQIERIHWLQRTRLKRSAWAWRLKVALREVYTPTHEHNSIEQAGTDLASGLSLVSSSRPQPLKRLGPHAQGAIRRRGTRPWSSTAATPLWRP